MLNYLGKNRYQQTLVISHILATIHAHFTQRKLVWNSKARYLPEFIKFFYGTTGQYVLNATLLFLLVEYLNFDPAYIQPLVAVVVAIISFYYFKTHVFKEKTT